MTNFAMFVVMCLHVWFVAWLHTKISQLFVRANPQPQVLGHGLQGFRVEGLG